MASQLRVKVAEAIQDDVNKGIVRIDSSVMRDIGLRPGDIVQIEGQRKTVGIVDRAYPGDIGLNIIRMDALIRKNARTSIGEFVSLVKADVKEAERITIAPAREGVVVKASPVIFKQGLLGRALNKGDIISLGGTRTRKHTMSGSPFFDDVFSMLDDNFILGFGFADLKFVVVETQPKQAVIITENTDIKLNAEAQQQTEETTLEVAYEDVGGLDEEITKIREMVELPLRHPEIFERLGIEPPKGVLLHGPPGTGKTLLAKAVAGETNCHFITINGPEIMSKYYGQSEENLRKKFEEAEKKAPSIIFIDEVDAIASKREDTRGEVERRVVAQLLTLMDGLKTRGRVVVIAATNVPHILDSALRRPGRFDREVEIGVPNKEERLNILKIHTRNMPLSTLHINPTILEQKVKQRIKKEIDTLNENIKLLNEKLSKLKEKSQNPESGLFQTLLSKIQGTEKKISEVETTRAQYQALHKTIQEDTAAFAEVIRQLKSMYDARAYYDVGDPRNMLISQSTESHEHTLTQKLLDLNVVTKDCVRETRSEGAQIDLEFVAGITHGFVGADLASLAKEAAMIALRRILPELKYDKDEPIPQDVLQKLIATKDDFIEALKVVQPSALREVFVEVPNVTWDSVGGLEDVKQEVKEAVEWPLKHPKAFARLGITPPKGILLYGPPGTGKTLLAKAIATESESNFISVKGPQLLSMWVGESEKGVRKVFEKARQTAPTVIFFDEFDAIAPRRSSSQDSHVTERVVNQLLTEIDGIQNLHNVVIIGATNRPDIIDTALLRPGRFDRIILTPAPDKETRIEVFRVHLKNIPLDSDVSVDELADQTHGYAGADIEAVCREAAMLALRENIEAVVVSKEHFNKALKKVPPSITADIEKSYLALQRQFSKALAKEMETSKPAYFG